MKEYGKDKETNLMRKLTTLLPLSIKNVRIKDSFWSKYVRLIRERVIPYQWDALNDRIPDAAPSHCIKNFRIAAGLEEGEFQGMIFQDSDLAKWLEAVAYSLTTHPDPELERIADEVIEIIAKAQQDDGYLNTYYTLREPGRRWTNFREGHELYCAGHMIEAAVAYYNATRKKKLLEVVCKLVDHIDSVIGAAPGKLRAYPGHQEIELALIKLYRITGDERYLGLSRYFIEERGREPYYFDIEAAQRGHTIHFPEFEKFDRKYAQTHLPVRQQSTAEGHAVRAVYMYSAMADLAAETGDGELWKACRRLWKNIVTKRMYITGSIGSTAVGEAFTFDYDLPNDMNYSETCASVGLIFFTHRMLQIEAKSCYADIMEKALYNTVLSGISLEGNRFFYVNPLEVWPEACAKNPSKHHVKAMRQKWFGVACCPPNIARMLTSLGQCIYSQNDHEVFVHLYIGSTADFEVGGQNIRLIQETDYPWAGEVRFSVILQDWIDFTLALRIPGWCKEATVKINGSEVNLASNIDDGYVKLKRAWSKDDLIELELSMPVVFMQSHPKVRANAGRVALQRGPLVYCVEEVDNGGNLQALFIPMHPELSTEFVEDLLGGIVVIECQAERDEDFKWDDQLYRPVENKTISATIKAIPYFLWNNREAGEMVVWIRRK